MKIVLGFTGEMAAGKGSASEFIKTLYPDTPSFRFSDSLREFYMLLLSHLSTDGAVLDKVGARALLAECATQAFGIEVRDNTHTERLNSFITWVIDEFVPSHKKSGWTPSASTKDLQWVSAVIRKIYGEDTLKLALMKRVHRSTFACPIVIIEGIRRRVDIVELMSDTSTLFRLVYIEADTAVRYERHRMRNEKPGDNALTFEQFLELGRAEAESEIRLLRKCAHLIISNNGEPKQMQTLLQGFVSSLVASVAVQ